MPLFTLLKFLVYNYVRYYILYNRGLVFCGFLSIHENFIFENFILSTHVQTSAGSNLKVLAHRYYICFVWLATVYDYVI